MHQSSYERMGKLRDAFLDAKKNLTIIDLGSMEVYGGTYRPLFERPGWRYLGMDLGIGRNVDIVLADPYIWPLEDASVDVVISGQALEHVEFFWLTFQELARVLRPGGRALLIAPSGGMEHRYPVDCWRFYPDAYRAMAKWTGLRLLEASADWTPASHYTDDSSQWKDCWGVFEKA